MRFADSIRINANPRWWSYYIPYDDLKARLDRLRHLHNAQFVLACSSQSNDGTRTTTAAQAVEIPIEVIRSDRRNDGGDSTDEEPDLEGPGSSSSRVSGDGDGPQSMRRTASEAVLHALETDGGADSSSGFPEIPRDDSQFPPLPLVSSSSDAAAQFKLEERQFFEKLDICARRADAFYSRMFSALCVAAENCRQRADAVSTLRAASAHPSAGADEESNLLGGYGSTSNATPHVDEHRLRADVMKHFREIHDTRNFANLNVKGYEKILKKHDKMTGLHTKDGFLRKLQDSTKLHNTSELDRLSEYAVRIYTKLFAHGDRRFALSILNAEVPDLVFWERGTNWADGADDKHKSSAMRTVRGGTDYMNQQSGPGKFEANPPVIALAVLLFLVISMFPSILGAIIGEVAVDSYPPQTFAAANRAFALLMFAVVLWAGKAIPLYATSFLVFAGAAASGVFVDENGNPLPPHAASDELVRHIGSPTVILILSVYAFASALKKYEIDRQIATAALSRLNPHGWQLLAWLMILSIFISMFISNVASPVLLTSVMKPTFSALLNMGDYNKKYVKGLLFGIMVACNVGGFVSPISSPQSAVAIGLLTGMHKLSFLMWIVVAVPLAVLMGAAIFLGLVYWFQLYKVKMPPMQKTEVRYTWGHRGTIVTLAATVLMWMIPWFSSVFGSTGMIAALPVAFIFGGGMLRKNDFNNLAWDVVILVAGGSVVGAAVESSKLLNMLSDRLLLHMGDSVYSSFAVLCVVIAGVSVVVSHTVSAIILLPLFFRVGEQFGRPQMFVLGGAIAASCAMATNVASFPNLTMSGLQDDKDENYVTNSEITWIGTPATIVSVVILITLGFQLLYNIVK